MSSIFFTFVRIFPAITAIIQVLINMEQMPDKSLPVYAQRLKELRQEKGIGQVALSDYLGVSKGIVSMWETGQREPSMSSLVALAKFYGVSIDYIVGISD